MAAGDTVYVAHEDHGTFVFASPLTLLKQRVDDGYWYEADPEAQAWGEQIVAEGLEDEAWIFLDDRKEYEYEYVERTTVR
jgi:hypothetical protein